MILGMSPSPLDFPGKAIEWGEMAWAIRALSDDLTGEKIAHCKSNIARSPLMLGREGMAYQYMDNAENIFNAASAWFHEAQ